MKEMSNIIQPSVFLYKCLYLKRKTAKTVSEKGHVCRNWHSYLCQAFIFQAKIVYFVTFNLLHLTLADGWAILF